MERLLNRVKPAVVGQPLDRCDSVAIRLHGQHQARADGIVVEEHGTGAADPVFTSDVGSGQPEILAEEVAQEQAGFDEALARRAVDGHRDRDLPCIVQAPGAPELN